MWGPGSRCAGSDTAQCFGCDGVGDSGYGTQGRIYGLCGRACAAEDQCAYASGSVVENISGIPFGRTDAALPMLWALENKVKADTFVIYTDSETWYGKGASGTGVAGIPSQDGYSGQADRRRYDQQRLQHRRPERCRYVGCGWFRRVGTGADG